MDSRAESPRLHRVPPQPISYEPLFKYIYASLGPTPHANPLVPLGEEEPKILLAPYSRLVGRPLLENTSPDKAAEKEFRVSVLKVSSAGPKLSPVVAL